MDYPQNLTASDRYWYDLIQKCRTSGKTDSQWLKENNIKPPTFYYHVKQLRKKACELPESWLSYENILAQAIARGTLKNYYLCVDKDYDIAIKNEIRNDKGKRPDKRRQATILKLLAAYMILSQLHPGQKFVLLQINRILNWLGFESIKGDR